MIRKMIVHVAVAVLCLSCGAEESDLNTTSRADEVTPSGGAGDGRVVASNNVAVDLAVILVDGSTNEALDDLLQNVLKRPLTDGRTGSEFIPGIQVTRGDYGVQKIAYVDFFPDATAAERQSVIDVLADTPGVEEVLRDVVPDEIRAD